MLLSMDRFKKIGLISFPTYAPFYHLLKIYKFLRDLSILSNHHIHHSTC